jgi:type III secretory pathway component EscS
LCLYASLPALCGAALCGGLVDFLQSRFGVSEPSPPALARLFGGLSGLALTAPWLGREIARFADALWTLLPALGG